MLDFPRTSRAGGEPKFHGALGTGGGGGEGESWATNREAGRLAIPRGIGRPPGPVPALPVPRRLLSEQHQPGAPALPARSSPRRSPLQTQLFLAPAGPFCWPFLSERVGKKRERAGGHRRWLPFAPFVCCSLQGSLRSGPGPFRLVPVPGEPFTALKPRRSPSCSLGVGLSFLSFKWA